MDRRRKVIHNSFFHCAVLISILLTGVLVDVCVAPAAENPPVDHVVVYYFHGNFRCTNCYNIEKFSREALDENFKDELDSGRLVFKVINIEEKGNEHFVNDYQLYTRSLVLSLVKNQEEIKSKNLTKVWEYLRDKPRFYQYVKDEVSSYLKEL